MSNIIVRPAYAGDVAQLVAVEQSAWKEEGTEVYGAAHFRSWLALYPEGFFVAEEDGRIVGFTYTEAVQFDPRHMEIFTSFNDITDHGYTRRTHRADGNYHVGVTMCSVSKGAGGMLLETLLRFSNERRRPLLGFSRIIGFAEYLASACAQGGIDLNALQKKTENAIALSYALECAKMTGGKIWEGTSAPAHVLALPPPPHPDPVLRFYLKQPELMLYGILPDFLHDPKSRDYSVLFGQMLVAHP